MSIGEITAHGQLHLPDLLIIFERSIDAVILHFTDIDPGLGRQTRYPRYGFGLKENAVAAFPEIVGLHFKLAEK